MLKRISQLFLFFAALFLSFGVSAQSTEPLSDAEQQQVMKKISDATASVRVMTSDFVQTRRSSMLAEAAVSRGTMCYERPDRLRWEYTSPRKGGIAVVGDSISMIGGDAKSAGKANRMMRGMSTMILNSMNGDRMFDQRMFTSVIYNDGNSYRALLTPKRRDMQRMFQSMTFVFDKSDLSVKRVVLAEKNGETTIDFSNIAIQK